MTDRLKGFIVTFAEDIRHDDADVLLGLLRQSSLGSERGPDGKRARGSDGAPTGPARDQGTNLELVQIAGVASASSVGVLQYRAYDQWRLPSVKHE